MLAAVILAGGLSKRFGTNKLLYKIDGEAIINRVFKAVSGLTENVYLSVQNREQADTLQNVCDKFRGIIVDSYEEVSGPINGIITSLKAVQCEEVIIIPGDMPFLSSEALSKFIDDCRGLDASSGSVYWPNGWVSLLLQYHRREDAVKNINFSTLRGQMSRPSDSLRAAYNACYIPVSSITKDSKTLINTNTPEDIQKIRMIDLSTSNEAKCIDKSTTSMFLQATHLLKSDASLTAEYYLSEGSRYEEEELYTLALHAYKDAKTCYRRISNDKANNIDEKINYIKSRLDQFR